MIGREYGGDGRLAEEESASRVARALGCRGWKRWPRQERDWFRRLAPTMARIPGLDRWASKDRKAVVQVMRAKGKAREAEYARLMAVNRKLRRALERVAGGR